MSSDIPEITPDMTLLDVVKINSKAASVFKAYDKVAGECLICNRLFEPLAEVAQRHNLDLDRMIAEIKEVMAQHPKD